MCKTKPSHNMVRGVEEFIQHMVVLSFGFSIMLWPCRQWRESDALQKQGLSGYLDQVQSIRLFGF